MKQLLVFVALLVVAFVVYSYLTQESATPPVSPPASTPAVVQSTPADQPPGQPTVLPPAPTPASKPPTPAPIVTPAPNPRIAEIEKVIRACAKRSGCTIIAYQPGWGVCRLTARCPSGNVANQQFIDELQRSGILRDIETGPMRPLTDRQGRSLVEFSLTIKWQ